MSLPKAKGASSPAKPCKHSGCPNTVTGRAYCKEHVIAEEANKRWTSDETNVYANDWRWRQLSETFRKINPLCEKCDSKGLVKAAVVTDHIKPINQGGDKYNWDNLQSLCRSCHRRKTVRDREARKG